MTITPSERAMKWSKENYDRTRIFNIYNQARIRAKRQGVPFTITTKWFLNKALTGGKCEVTGLPFDHSTPTVKRKMNPFSASLDRVIPELGYTPDNCRVVCWIHNRAKGSDGMNDLYTYCRAFVRAIEGE